MFKFIKNLNLLIDKVDEIDAKIISHDTNMMYLHQQGVSAIVDNFYLSKDKEEVEYFVKNCLNKEVAIQTETEQFEGVVTKSGIIDGYEIQNNIQIKTIKGFIGNDESTIFIFPNKVVSMNFLTTKDAE